MEVRSSESLWKEAGGYYTETAAHLIAHPVLPDLCRLRDRRVLELFERYAGLTPASHVIEVGCGRSPWLAYLARAGYLVAGIDIEPYAAELAKANLRGAGMRGDVHCRDAFDLRDNEDLLEEFDLVYSMGVMEHFENASERLAALGKYLRPGGRILTTVPNLQGVNWLLQRLADLERLNMHVIYNVKGLTQVHEVAGFKTIAAGYAGFYDGYLSATGESTGKIRRLIHQRLCWALSMGCEAWVRMVGEIATPESRWFAPHVFYVGAKSELEDIRRV